MKIDIYFDGACKNIKGSTLEPFGVGIAVFINDVYSVLHSRFVGGEAGTSNIAEWEGCVRALETAEEFFIKLNELHKEKQITPVVTIYSDSQLITRQFNGEYEVRKEHFIEYYDEAIKIAKRIDYKKIVWVPREQNTHADILSKQGLTQIRKIIEQQNYGQENNQTSS